MNISGNNQLHSILSASSAHRWSSCPASAYYVHKEPERTSGFAAAEGTALHELLEKALLTGKNAEDFPTLRLEYDADNVQEVPITEEQVEILQAAIDYARNIKGELQAEQRIFYGDVLGVENQFAFGTGDITVIDTDTLSGNAVLHIVDAKFGRTPVVAQGNTQLALYAAGTLNANNLMYNFETVVMHIIQPRISYHGSQWEATPQEVYEIVQSMQPKAKRVVEIISSDKLETSDYAPSSGTCTYCPAVSLPCPAQAKLLRDVDTLLGSAKASDIADGLWFAELGEVLTIAERVEPLLKELKDSAFKILKTGGAVKGYKLVKQRAGNKYWQDATAAAEALTAIMGADGVEAAYKEPELRTPTQVLKLPTFKTTKADSLETKESKSNATETLMQFVGVREDVLSLVEDADPRPAVSCDMDTDVFDVIS